MDKGEGVSPNITNVKNELVNVHTISKNIDQEGRNDTAKKIADAREDTKSTSQTIDSNEEKVKEISNLTTINYKQERQMVEDLGFRLETFVVKLKNLVGIDDKQMVNLQEKIDAIQSESNLLYKQSFELSTEISNLKEKQIDIPNPNQLLETYYEKIATTPISNEQKRDLLTPEILSNLSTDEYIALWRRLNPHFLGHITRQGFRDHTGGDVMVNHHGGYQEFVNGFVDVMKNGKNILPPLSRLGLINREDSTIKSFLSEMLIENTSKESAKDMFYKLLNSTMASAPKYPDITSTHFTAQIIADRYYGGESENEVFFVYPSDVLASQYNFAFNGWEKDFTKPQSELKWNDVFVWSDPNSPGIPVDSGIVFLPENTPVDPDTGSRYASEKKIIDGLEQRVMIEDINLVNSFLKWGETIDQQPFFKIYAKYKNEKNNSTKEEFRIECQKSIVDDLNKLNIPYNSLNYIANNLMEKMYWRDSIDENLFREIIENSAINIKLAENTVSAKEYWEKFFENNPDLKPKHIHYYDGDPTNAIYKFQQQNNIGRANTSNTDGKLLGFDDMHILDMEKDPRSNVGYDELIQKSNKIIDDYYSQK